MWGKAGSKCLQNNKGAPSECIFVGLLMCAGKQFWADGWWRLRQTWNQLHSKDQSVVFQSLRTLQAVHWTTDTQVGANRSVLSPKASSAMCLFSFLLFSLALCGFAYWTLGECVSGELEILSLKNEYLLGQDLASLVFAFQVWWKNRKDSWGRSRRPWRFAKTDFKLEEPVCVFCSHRIHRQFELKINSNLGVLALTNSKSLKHCSCVSSTHWSLILLFVSSFLCLPYNFFNLPLIKF